MNGSEENKENMQKDLDIVYKSTEKNLMEFDEKKFEPMSYGTNNNIMVTSDKGPTGKEIVKQKSNI